jgi:hypothetical protein
MKSKRPVRTIAAFAILILVQVTSVPVFADTAESPPKDHESFLGPAYEPEYKDANGKNPQGLSVSIPVQGFVVPAEGGNGNGGGSTVVPVPEDKPEDEGEDEVESGESSGAGASEIPPRPAEQPGGVWRWDEDLGAWIFDEDNPLGEMTLMDAEGNLPQTGFAGALSAFPPSAPLLAEALLLLLAIPLFLRRRGPGAADQTRSRGRRTL